MGTEADPVLMQSVAERLQNAATDLENGETVPELPELGAATGAVAGALAVLTDSTAGVVEGFGALGNAVAHSGQEYQSNDQAQGEHLASIWGR